MRIFLVRHGESQANCDSKLHTIFPDHEIALSSKGEEQAEYAGEFLKAYLEKDQLDSLPLKENNKKILNEKIEELFSSFDKDNKLKTSMFGLLDKFGNDSSFDIKPKIKLYHSPYRRTRQTTNFMIKAMKPLISEIKEDVLLVESQHGLFDGLEEDEQKEKFPEEFKLFQKTEEHNGKFWARYPHGESAFDVAIRLRTFFQSLKEDEENGVSDVVIIAHGITMKVFAMAWLNETPEWYEEEKSPGNCAIRVLDKNKDLGYIYGGHRSGKSWSYPGNLKKK